MSIEHVVAFLKALPAEAEVDLKKILSVVKADSNELVAFAAGPEINTVLNALTLIQNELSISPPDPALVALLSLGGVDPAADALLIGGAGKVVTVIRAAIANAQTKLLKGAAVVASVTG